jgi:hypothetical protein
MALRRPDWVVGPFHEQDTVILTAIVRDETGTPIPASALESMTMSLYSETDPFALLNSRDDVNILANVDAAGLLTLELTTADMAMEDDDNEREAHRVLLEWTWDGGKRGSAEVQVLVQNLEKVPTA